MVFTPTVCFWADLGSSPPGLGIWLCAFTPTGPLTGLTFQDLGLRLSALPSTQSCSDPFKGLGVIHAAAHFNLGLECVEGPELLMPATFREAVRGLQGAGLDVGLLLFLFQASRQLRLLSVDSVQRTVPDAVGWGWELKNVQSSLQKSFQTTWKLGHAPERISHRIHVTECVFMSHSYREEKPDWGCGLELEEAHQERLSGKINLSSEPLRDTECWRRHGRHNGICGSRTCRQNISSGCGWSRLSLRQQERRCL